jgi:hypothetical protein
MAVTIQFVENTPNRVRYLITSDGVASVETIPNAGGPTPDLATDSNQISGNKLHPFLLTAVVDDFTARKLLQGEQLIGSGVPALNTARGKIRVTNCFGGGVLAVVPRFVAGFAAIELQSFPNALGDQWYVDMEYYPSRDRSVTGDR